MKSIPEIVAVDLFCGVGGLTRGLIKSGISVRLGVDLDPACRFPLEENNAIKFLQKDVSKIEPSEITEQFGNAKITLLAGCAPCQPFSTYYQSMGKKKRHKDWGLLRSFQNLVIATKPTLVTMENVPPLETKSVFKEFVRVLEVAGYYVSHKVVDGREIGLPQRRKRLVLIASRLGPINFPESEYERRTVRDVLGDLPKIEAGESHPDDRLHVSASLSELNLARIRHSKPGGTWRDWPEELVASCHTKTTGKTYPSVYGRMEWDEPAPTMTTQCYGFGNGRFGHPQQDRAISLREAAIIQSFPRKYAFIPETDRVNFNSLGRLIGNAVPVRLGEYIGGALVLHVEQFADHSKPVH